MGGLHSSSYFQVHQSLYQNFGDSTKCANYYWYPCHLQVPWGFFFSFLARSRYLSLLSLSFSFTLWSAGTTKSTIRHVFFFGCYWLSLVLVAYISLRIMAWTDTYFEFAVERIFLKNDESQIATKGPFCTHFM